MTAINVEAFQIRTTNVQATTYTVLLMEGADGGLFSMTFHPYQIEKLHRAISPRAKTLTADSDALRMFDSRSAKLLISFKELATDEDLLAVFTSGEWKEHYFSYRVTTHGEEFNLVFEGASALRLLECLERIIDQVRAQRTQ